MGGHAFASGAEPLETPRMPPEVYLLVRDWTKMKLQELFIAVAAPIDGPAKDDFGDVDVLVAHEKSQICPGGITHAAYENAGGNIWVAIEHLLGAKRKIKDKGQPAAHFAVPWPRQFLPATETDSEDLYIQVDVTICPTLEFLSWRLFKHGHGDFWNILGSSLRPLGLTIDDGALWLRHPEIERHHRRRSKILLSADPRQILSFLGMAYTGTEWEQPFDSVDELYKYITTCNYFFTYPSQEDDVDNEDDPSTTGSNNQPAGAASAAEPTNSASDRRKAKDRPVVARYFDEFLPNARSAMLFPPPDGYSTPYELRSLVRCDAFDFFPNSEAVYNRTITDWDTEQSSVRAWTEGIRAVVPPAVALDVKLAPGQLTVVDDSGQIVALMGSYRGVICKALKKIVVGSDGAYERYGVAKEDMARLRDERGVLLLEEVKDFVVRHWEKVGSVAWPETQERSAENLKMKMESEEQKRLMLAEEEAGGHDEQPVKRVEK